MATTFNAVAFQTRIDKARARANKAGANFSAMSQRVQKRLDRLEKARAKGEAEKDAELGEHIVTKVGYETIMAECDREKSEANYNKLCAYVRQLTREGELKAERAERKAAKKGPAVWSVRTPDGAETPIACTDGSFGKLVGRSKRAEIGTDTFSFLLGDECVGVVADVDGAVIVCNEMEYTVDIASVDGKVVLNKVAK